MPGRRLLVEWLLIGIVSSLAILLAIRMEVLRSADNLIFDLFAVRYAPAADDRILIAEIDTLALEAVGPWPWSRDVHAAAVRKLDAANARAILYDVLFLEPQREDAALAEAMAGGTPVFLPLLIETPGMNGAAARVIRPSFPIDHAARGVGSANLLLDPDGQSRSVDLTGRSAHSDIPHFVELAYRAIRHAPSPAWTRQDGQRRVDMMPIRPAGGFRSISIAAILNDEVSADFLKDKYILVGATAPGLSDLHPVAVGRHGRMPGIEIQANLLNNLLADRFVAPVPRWTYLALSLIPLWLLLLAFWFLRPALNFKLSMAQTAATLLLSIAFLTLNGIWFPPMAALLGIVIVYPLWGWRRLVALNHFMVHEIDTLTRSHDLPAPAPRTAFQGDRVAEEASRLQQVIDMIRQASREREEMLQFLSHDMRAPQAAIIALTEEQQGERSLLPARVEQVRRHARHTLRLADDFVQLARVEASAGGWAPVDVSDCLQQAVDMVWPLARKSQVRLKQASDDALHWASGDDDMLVRAFTNLLDNAIRHSPEGGEVRTAIALDGCDIRVRIEDDGPGLPAERRANPWRRFGGPSDAGREGQPHQGVGLGLAYVHAAVLRHKGRIAYEDGSGGGACFIIDLPATDQPVEE